MSETTHEPVEADDAGHEDTEQDTPEAAPSPEQDGSEAQPQEPAEGTPVTEAENPNP